MKNLIIGKSSQLSYFFPVEYERISSRDIDMNYLRYNRWDSVYITFAEQRVYMSDIDYINPNFIYTRDVLENLVGSSNKIVIYGSCDLWNNKIGCVYPEDEFDYSYSNDYCLSKEKLINYIKERREKGWWKNVIIIHPFNFNSTYRKQEFLFGKIFNSIINKTPIEIGNTNFYRDIVHTKYMVERSIKATKDEIVGSGRLYFIHDFIKDLYNYFGMDYKEYVKSNDVTKSRHSERIFYSYQDEVYTYDMLLKDTIEDIEKRIKLSK
jgi:nucleoside-diphosphate-sugar epimerase